MTTTPPPVDLPADPTLAAVVVEVESHVAAQGWDRPSRLFALVPTTDLREADPQLAETLGLDAPDTAALVPVESDDLPEGVAMEELLTAITWPGSVAGCVAAVERVVLPPEAEADLPADPGEAESFASNHPMRQEVRIVAGATRTGSSYCAMRLRSHDNAESVLTGDDLVPGLVALLRQTLEDDPEGEDRETVQ